MPTTKHDARSIDATGLIWQRTPHGEKVIGEVHRTRSGRYYVIIVGTRVLGTNSAGKVTVRTYAEAEAAALAFEPTDGSTARALAAILDPTAAR